MALIRARALGALAFGGVDGAGARVPGPGLGGGGGAGRAAADALPVVGGTGVGQPAAGGGAPAAARAAGSTRVGAPASAAGRAPPHERHEPTSVSLWAPPFGQPMWPFVGRAPKEGQGSGAPRGATFLHWK